MSLIDISIIIPTFQRSKILEKIFSSIVNQKFYSKKVEVLIIDSFSEDNTKVLVKKFSKKKSFKFQFKRCDGFGKYFQITFFHWQRGQGDILF
jgi:glycosyltransferase involved in cell wall biosynthesis